MLPLHARVDLGVMTMKRYTAFPIVSGLQEPHHQIVLYYIQETRWESLTPLQRSSWRIQQLQLTKPKDTCLGEVLPLGREAIGVFYSPSRLGNPTKVRNMNFSFDIQYLRFINLFIYFVFKNNCKIWFFLLFTFLINSSNIIC